MADFKIDAYKNYTLDEMKIKCRELARANINKDMLICALVQFGDIENIPSYQKEQINRIVSAYSDPDDKIQDEP